MRRIFAAALGLFLCFSASAQEIGTAITAAPVLNDNTVLARLQAANGLYSTRTPVVSTFTTYANAPTLTWSGPGGASGVTSGITVPYTGQTFAANTSAQTTSGAVLTFANTNYMEVGQSVTHLPGGSSTSCIPAGTTIASMTGTTVTLSASVTCTVANGDQIGFGPVAVSFPGMTPSFYTHFSQNYYQNGVNAAWTSEMYAVDFDYYGTKFALVYADQTGSGGYFWVWEDGQPVTSGMGQASGITGSGGSEFFMLVNFNNASDNTARWRHIRIYMNYAYFGGIIIGPTDAISPSRSHGVTQAWYGDSYCEGAVNLINASQTKTIPEVLAQVMGWNPPYVACQGGTGYTANGGGAGKAAYTDSTRIAALIATQANEVFIEGSVNDSGATPAQVTTGATTALTAIKNGMPNSKIFVIGVQNTTQAMSSANIANNNAVKAVAQSLGLTFIDAVDEGWITGTGHVGGTTGVGNADVFIDSDGVHPTALGAEYEARRIAFNVRAAFGN